MLLTSSCDIVCCGLSRCKHHENYFETWISVHDVVLWRSLHVSSSERPLMFFWHIHACISNATRWRMTAPWIPQLWWHSHMTSLRAIILLQKKTTIYYVLVAQQHVAVIEMQGTLAARLLQPWH